MKMVNLKVRVLIAAFWLVFLLFKNNVGIDIGIVPKVSGYNMQNHDDHLKLWTHALAIYGSSKFAFALKTSRLRLDVPKLSWAPVLNFLACIQK